MGKHLRVYLREHPEFRLLESASDYDRELLLRAAAKRYITLLKAPTGDILYSQDLLEQAYIWKDKGELDSVKDRRQEMD